MGRKILLITTDQQRYDSLRCNGGTIAQTPVADRLAREGLNFRRAHTQNVVCMPSRATIHTGQYPRTHGVVCNGIPLPEQTPNVARYLREEAGYHTALIGKSHFEPHIDFTFGYAQNRLAASGHTGPWLGFDHVETALHGPIGGTHYSRWLMSTHPDEVRGFAAVLTGLGGGDTGAPEVAYNPIPREHYHTDWVAERTIATLSRFDQRADWFVWISFPDPHHPWDPPEAVARRFDWRDLPLPPGYPGSPERAREILAQKPQHWLDWFDGRFSNPEGGPRIVPAAISAEQIREVNAMVHAENELIDEACGRVWRYLVERGLDAETDIFFTTDHGELQGDFGLLFKGPYHVDALMRLPLLWRPAPVSGVAPAVVPEPVGLIDLAPTFCQIAGVAPPPWMQGRPLPTAPGSDRQQVITTWDSQFASVGMHLMSICREGFTLTLYQPSTRDSGGRFPILERLWGAKGRVPLYQGHEGELYDLANDPLQWRNLWQDPAYRAVKVRLIDALVTSQPPPRAPLKVAAPA